MKTKWLLVIVAIGLAVAAARMFLPPAGSGNGGAASFAREEPPAPDPMVRNLLQAYADYNLGVNANRGTRGVQYYPCPTGFRCAELIPPSLQLPVEKIVFDRCNGDSEACLILATDFLIKSGVLDVESFLSAHKRESP